MFVLLDTTQNNRPVGLWTHPSWDFKVYTASINGKPSKYDYEEVTAAEARTRFPDLYRRDIQHLPLLGEDQERLDAQKKRMES